MKNNDNISRSALLAEIARHEAVIHPCDRLEVDNVKQIIMDAPGVDISRDLRAQVETDIATGRIAHATGALMIRHIMRIAGGNDE